MALALKLLLQHPHGLFDVVVSHQNLHLDPSAFVARVAGCSTLQAASRIHQLTVLQDRQAAPDPLAHGFSHERIDFAWLARRRAVIANLETWRVEASDTANAKIGQTNDLRTMLLN
jgi:hypothetical protein